MMGEYLLSLISLAIVFDVLEYLSAEKYKGITRAALGLLLTVAVIAPIPGLIADIKGDLVFSDVGDLQGDDIRLAAFSEGIASYIASEFDLSADDVSIEVIEFDPTEMRAEKILITLSGRAAIANYKQIESAVDKLDLGDAEVKIEI